jgi:hypothetical protein
MTNHPILKIILPGFALLLLLFFGNSSGNYAAASATATAAKAQFEQTTPESQPTRRSLDEGESGTLQKMIVQSGSVTMDLDLSRLNGISFAPGRPTTLQFAVAANSFFPILVFNSYAEYYRNANSDSYCHCNRNAYSHCYCYCYCYTNSNGNYYANSDSYCHCNAYSYWKSDCYAYGNGHTDGYSNPNANIYSTSKSDTKIQSATAAAADSPAAPAVRRIKLGIGCQLLLTR